MITGVVLARNEESNIVACLQALQPHVDEILLIDMESGDRTRELAQPYVKKILNHPLIPNFDTARNIAISEGTYDWFWFVNADERISDRTGQLIRQLLKEQGHNFEALTIPFKSYFCDRWMQHCGWWPGYTMPRVLKRGAFQFREKLHGGVEVTGRQAQLPPDPQLAVDHYSYRSIEHYLEKLNRYTTTEARQLAANGAQWDWRDATRDMVRDLWIYYEANPGVRDGDRGWILSWLSGQYRWLARAKLIDLASSTPDRPPADGGEAPQSIDELLEVWHCELSGLRKRNPRLPLGIIWRSPLFDPSGYADEGRAFAKALAAGERPLRVEEFRWSDDKCPLNYSDEALLWVLTRCPRPPHFATITDCIPTLVEPDPSAALNVIRTTFETDRIPPHWRAHLDKFDEVWVTSQQTSQAFRRSGVPPEKIRVVPSCYDSDLFMSQGPMLSLPSSLAGRFVFLSVFDWQKRKGWDVLLRAYCQEFTESTGVGLLLKVSRAHGLSQAEVMHQANEVLSEFGLALDVRPDIVIWDACLSAREMAALYRSAEAFVLPSRGEGWGRPLVEALACGLPTIATRNLGSDEFLRDEICFLIDSQPAAVPVEAVAEIPVYRGHVWQEPDLAGLRRALREVYQNPEAARTRAKRAAEEMPARFSLVQGRAEIVKALEQAERRFQPTVVSPMQPDQIRIALEGEFFALHSFSNINEQLALLFAADSRFALSLAQRQNQPTYEESIPHAWQLRPYLLRPLGAPPQITIRHAFPPNWEPPHDGLWVHMQPWEFGALPVDWLAPLRDQVDEIWVPTSYVKGSFERSGVPGHKIRVMSWGVDAEVFTPQAEPLLLETQASFRFLFVGGLISRKGFDLLLEAYLAEFGPEEDVCLVIKDVGSQTFYRVGNHREQLLAALNNRACPKIVYIEEQFTAGQLASLYTACQCFVAPYRAEGFGLPILEAMACGLPPIVPEGGATADFVSSSTAYLVPSQTVETTHDWPLVGPPVELSTSVQDVRKAMRRAFEERQHTAQLGHNASRFAHHYFTWQQSVDRMSNRLQELAGQDFRTSIESPVQVTAATSAQKLGNGSLAACLAGNQDHQSFAHSLSCLTSYFDETFVFHREPSQSVTTLVQEYGAKMVAVPDAISEMMSTLPGSASSAEWLAWFDFGDSIDPLDLENLRDVVRGQSPEITQLSVQLRRSKLTDRFGRASGQLQLRRRTTCSTNDR